MNRFAIIRRLLPVFLFSLAAAPLCGQSGSTAAAAEKSAQSSFPKRVNAPPMSYRGAEWLEREDREQTETPRALIEAMGLEAGDVVVDLGCGSGYFARKMAPLTQPGGKVLGVDIQPEMLEIMMDHARAEGVEGITPIPSEPGDPKLPRGEVDWILLVDVYHEFAFPEKMLEKMLESLAPGGRVALVEYRVEDGTGDHIKPDHRMSVRQVLEEWEPSGFELIQLREFLKSQHLFIFGAARDPKIPPLTHLDLIDAIESHRIEVSAVKAGDSSVQLGIRKTIEGRVIVTSPVGVYFDAAGRDHDRVARRDGAILLDDGAWRDWTILTAPLTQSDATPPPELQFTIQDAFKRANLARMLWYLQWSGAPVPTVREAVRLAASGGENERLEAVLRGGGIEPEIAHTLALMPHAETPERPD